MISAKIRPYTGIKSSSKNNKHDGKIVISSLQRPSSAKNISLQRIIQVI